jgi:hypothetical protein
MTEVELETTIERLVERLNATREGSAEHRMVVRQLDGIRDRSQLAEQILEEHGYWGHGVSG